MVIKLTSIFIILFILFLGNVSAPYSVINTEIYPTDLEKQILTLVNKERSNSDLNIFYFHSLLIDLARNYSKDMLENNYFSHIDLNENNPGDRLTKAGVNWLAYAENIAFITGISDSIADKVVSNWMNSTDHRENILNREMLYTGIGVASNESGYMITQIFINAELQHLKTIGNFYTNVIIIPSTTTTIHINSSHTGTNNLPSFSLPITYEFFVIGLIFLYSMKKSLRK